MTEDEQVKKLMAALKPFADAYEAGSTLTASSTLSDWEAMAKHHTPGNSYRNACIAMTDVLMARTSADMSDENETCTG